LKKKSQFTENETAIPRTFEGEKRVELNLKKGKKRRYDFFLIMDK